MKIDILGTEYDFEETTAERDSRLSDETDGYCDRYDKRIAVEVDFYEDHQTSVLKIDEYKKNVKRHEIIHAFLAESGMNEWCDNELFVEWIAWQFPKMLKTFQAVGCI